MAKYSFRRYVEWLEALYLLGLRIPALMHLLIYLLTQSARGVGPIKPAISAKWLKIERKLLLSAYI